MAHSVPRRAADDAASLSATTSTASSLAAPHTQPSWVQRGDSVLNVACIGGAGGKGAHDREEMAHHPSARIAAICDVDEQRLERAGEQYADASTHIDYREMLSALEDSIDCVTVSCPDHAHCHAAMMAMHLGKHVYVQKPISHSIEECRMMGAKQQATGLVTQMGNQGASSLSTDTTRRILRSGYLGKISRVHTWTNRPIWPQGGQRPEGSDPVPAYLNWDLWLNGAPERPFKNNCYHPFNWRGWWDFGTGAFGDIGCHALHVVTTTLGLDVPYAVHCDAPDAAGEMHPSTETVTMKFAPTMYTAFEGCELKWYDGGRMPDVDEEPALWDFEGEYRFGLGGNVFVGERGVLVESDGGPYWLMKDGSQPADPQATEVQHYHGWLNTILGVGDPVDQNRSSFFTAVPLTEICLLGTLAARFPGLELQWDAASMSFPQKPEANAYVSKVYREGFDPHEFI